jgi:UDP-N-acetylmuramate-alanine ligase
MIAQVLGCGYCIGGEVPGFDGVAKDGEIMVVEADESDGTIVNYHPDIAVITNIEYDHMEHHASVEAFESCFKTLIANTKQKVVYCAEDAAAARLCAGSPKAVSYGVAGGMWNVALPGRHNRLNASAAIEVSRQWKTDAEIFQALEKIKPVRRRFEKVFAGEYTIISDYAHHPTEIRTLIQTVRETLNPKRLLGVFQPHRYTRTKALMADFPPAFQGLDTLWLVPVYAASEKPLKGGTTEDLAGNFPAAGGPEVKNFHSLEKAWHDIKKELRAGDVLLIIGAGDIEKIGEWSRVRRESV